MNVFLASPSDVGPERSQAEEVVTAVNRLAGRHFGVHIELYRWEDTPPGFGRPQEIINQMVDECDLFIGLLWERWGQSTGKYSSGFEEEFERARDRRKTQGQPEIWLVFKEIDESKLKDPGPQLSHVLEFRKQQTERREILFTTVKTGKEWKNKLQTWLLESVFKLGSQQAQQPTSTVPTTELSQSSRMPSDKENAQVAVPFQLRKIASSLSHVLQGGMVAFSSTENNPLQEFEVARLFLFISTLSSNRYTKELLGTHDINLLYKHRDKLELTSPEQFLLFRSILGSTGDVRPGWFWFRQRNGEELRNLLLFSGCNDSSQEVRVGALTLLTAARIQIPEKYWRALPLNHDSFPVREAALKYLAVIGNERTFSLLDEISTADDPTIASAIRESRFAIQPRLDPAKAFSDAILNNEYISRKNLEGLGHAASVAEENVLLKGAESSWEELESSR